MNVKFEVCFNKINTCVMSYNRWASYYFNFHSKTMFCNVSLYNIYAVLSYVRYTSRSLTNLPKCNTNYNLTK